MINRLHHTGFSSIAFIALGLAALFCTAAITGCGRGNVDSSVPPPPTAASSPKTVPTGPAITEKLTFDQLALDSPVKKIKTKQGPTYLEFAYTDRDGKVYKCRLPEAMTEGSYLPDEWIRTFNLYRLPEVIKQKPAPKTPLVKAVPDFPFISPRPVPQKDTAQQPAPQQHSSQQPTPQLPEPQPGPPPALTGPGSSVHGRGQSDLD